MHIFTADISSHLLVDNITFQTVIHLHLITMIGMENRLVYSNEQQQQVIISKLNNILEKFLVCSCILIIIHGQEISLFYPLVRFYSL